MIGKTLSHYSILERVSNRGDRVVYKAHDLAHGGFVALQFLPAEFRSDPEIRQEFLRYARAISALDHGSIAGILDVLQINDELVSEGSPASNRLIIVRPWYDGQMLATRLGRGPLSLEQSLNIAAAIADGLARAHEAGLLHRELTPESIVLTERGLVRILDFGVASARSCSRVPGTDPATGLSLPPELTAASDAQADVYALAVILFKMLGGRLSFTARARRYALTPFLASSPSRHLPPEIPEPVRQILDKALSADPAARYQTAREFLADLEIAREPFQAGRTTSAATLAARRKRQHLTLRSMTIAGLLLLILAGLYAVPPILREEHLASNPKRILIGSFRNLTGIDSLDYFQIALQHQLITSLEQSVYFRPTSWNRLIDLKKQANRDDAKIVDERLGLELCQLDKAEALLTGTIALTGNQFTIAARLVDPTTHATLMTPVSRGRGIETFFEQVDHLSREISRGFGVSARRTDETIRPIDEISTRSQHAYQLALAGWEEVRTGKRLEAIRHFTQAVQEDSLFAWAWIGLRVVNLDLGYSALARHATTKAISLFERASEKDKLSIARIDTSLRAIVMGRPGASYLDFLRYRVMRFPEEKDYLFALGLELQTFHGRIDEAIDAFNRSLELDPQFGFAMSTLARAYAEKSDFRSAMQVVARYLALSPTNSFAYHIRGDVEILQGKYDDAIASYTRARALEPTFVEHTMKIARTHFWREQYDDVLRWIDSASVHVPSPGKKADLLWSRALCMYWLGRLNDAEALLRQRRPLLDSIGDESDGFLEAWIALERNHFHECRNDLATWSTFTARDAGEAELLPRTLMQSQFCLGLVDLREGKLDSVKGRLAQIERIRALIPNTDSSYLGNQAAEIAEQAHRLLMSELLLLRRRPADIPAMYPPRSRGLHWDPLLAVDGPGWRGVAETRADIPYESDGLARAYVALGSLDSAIAQYEAFLAINTRRWGVPPRLHYRLAKLYDMKGLQRLAMVEYEKFLRIWGKADPMYQEPADARQRLAALKGHK